ncbi:hypothetical protein BX666DRAFT_1938456 [Dichotomocladium elegans]|nr:hypothetical protein BX666DRAFT_1938456 [Dichotomocladium elegans]
MTGGERNINWSHFKRSLNPLNGNNLQTPLEERHGYFDLALGNDHNDQHHQEPQEQTSTIPRIFTIEPSLTSNEEDDRPASCGDTQSTSNTTTPPPQRGVSFRPKLEYVGRAYSIAAQSVTTLDDLEPRSKKERFILFLHKKFPSRIVRRILKCTIAYFLSTLFSLIHPVAQALGPGVFLTTGGVLFNHPGRTMGAQFDATITSALGICMAMGFTYWALACSVAYNNHYPELIGAGTAINATFLFVGIFAAQMIRQLYPRFFFFSLQGMMVMIFSLAAAPGLHQTSIPIGLPLRYGIPLLTGAALSQIVNLFVWPETAVEGLGRALKETLGSSREMLDMITKQFFLDPESEMITADVVEKTAEEMRRGMLKVKTAYHEAKYEISYTYIRPYELGNVQKALDRLTRHLNILGGSLKTERILFENAIASLELLNEKQKQQEQPVEMHPTDVDSEPEDTPRKSTLRWLNQEDEMRLRKAAMLATGASTTSPQNSRPNSRVASRAGSRAGSRRNSLDVDFEEQNQKSVSSIRSFLNLSKFNGPKPKPPPKVSRSFDHTGGELLIAYLESLRDPLMRLSMDCVSVVDCLSHSIVVELDMDDDDDKSIWKTWSSYLTHIFKLKPRKVDNASLPKCRLPHEPNECNCTQKIKEAIRRFDREESERMQQLYNIEGHTVDLDMREELFLVFFFIFSLRESAKELGSMASTMDDLRSSRRDRHRRHLYMPQLTQKWWRKWASTANHQSIRDKGGYSMTTLRPAMIPKDRKKNDIQDEYRLTRLKTCDTLNRKTRRMSSTKSEGSSAMFSPCERVSSRATVKSCMQRKPSDAPSNDNSLRPPAMDDGSDLEAVPIPKDPKPPLLLRVRYRVWQTLQYTKNYDFKFALKVAAAVLVLSIPSFVPSSSAWYDSVRGQWSCMTVIAIMNPTSGGTYSASFWRIVGTLVGAFTGWAALEANGGSPYLLAGFAVLLCIPFFYIHLASTYNKIGIVVLLTYMAVALSRYVSVSADSIAVTVWKRTITMVVGIIVAVSLNWLIWPFVARHAVRKSLASIIGELGDYYAYLIGTFLFHDPAVPPSDDEVKGAQKMEGAIQKSINACHVLLELTDNEPRLKGPFPKAFYTEMIVSTRNLLDRLMSIRTALTGMPRDVKREICQRDLNTHRRDMTASMLLHFYTLQSSLKSKIPLPAYMPSARAARSRLIRYQRKLKVDYRWVRYRNLCWFAMASCTEEIILELEHLSDLVRFIVGENKFAERTRRLEITM